VRATLAAALLLARVAFAQIPEDELRSKIARSIYPPLARAARVQGDVVLQVHSDGVTLVSGPPLLVQAAIENAKSLGLTGGVTLTYHFVLFRSTTVPTFTPVKKGDAFDRLVLRIFGLKTERTVREDRCVPGVAPPNDVKISERGIDVWVNGAENCVMVETAYFTAGL